jgi:hypothetical protein
MWLSLMKPITLRPVSRSTSRLISAIAGDHRTVQRNLSGLEPTKRTRCQQGAARPPGDEREPLRAVHTDV